MKKIYIAIGLFFVGAVAFAKQKTNEVINIVNSLKFEVADIRDIDINFKRAKIVLDLKLINKTDYNFNLNAEGVITLHRVEIFTDTGIKIADANLNFSNVSLAPQGVNIIEDVEFTVDFFKSGSKILQILANTPNKIKAKAHLSILGTNYIV
mgnify:CR=1 FL=1